MSDDSILALQSQLGPGEKLLWSGRPRQGFSLRAQDALLIPFSLMWGGFALFWEATVLASNAPYFFKLWGIPFVLIGLYIVFGRFVVDSMQRARCYYGVTSERIIVVSGFFGLSVKSLSLRTLTDLSMDQKANGSGTISFGAMPPFASWNSALWPGAGRQLPPRFEMIPDVKSVYEIIRRAQRST